MISVVIATCGSREWSDLAWSRAYPSVAHLHERYAEVIVEHIDGDATVEQARNYGAAKATRPWLVFLDADDALAPDFIPKIVRRIETDGNVPLRLYAPAVSFVDLAQMTVTEPKIPNTHLTMPPLNHCAIGTAVARLTFEQVGGFREGYRPWEDYELWLRCIRAGCTVQYVEEAVYVAHVTEGSRSDIPRREAVRLAQRIHREHRRPRA